MAGIRKFRFSERRETRNDDTQAPTMQLTSEDEANLEAFSDTLVETLDILNAEITAIGAGNLEAVSELYHRKANLMKWLELKSPLIEPFLTLETDRTKNILDQLQELKTAVAEDSELLSRMSTAARDVVKEIKKANERNGLNGIYGKSGQPLGNLPGGRQRIDREF